MTEKNIVFVTGGAGYVGSVLIPELIKNGYYVKCLDRFFFGDEFLSQEKFEENLELYDINIVNFPNISKIEVYVYSTSSLDYKTIERLNFQIQRLLEEFNIQKGTYELIVSSPGVERLLKTSRHYEISQQELIKVKLIELY